jgi:transposase InsO family protein
MAWLYELDNYFLLTNIKEKQKVATATMGLRDDAKTFAYYLVVSNHGMPLPWYDFRSQFVTKYENSKIRGLLLRQKLDAIQYHGPDRMAEYCEEFRKLEAQIYDMAFVDRVKAFVSKIHPPQAATHILNGATVQEEKMEFVYQLARQWATNYRVAGNINGSTRHSRHNRRLLKFGKTKSSSPASPSSTTAAKKESDSEDDLEFIQPEELNKLDLMQVTCYNCGKRGHFKRNCKSPPRDKQVNFKSSGTNKSLYQAAELEDVQDIQDYGVLDPSTTSDTETDSDDLNLMSTYEFNHDHTSVKSSNGLSSRKLPVYESRLNDEPAKTIIDCGASTLFLNEDMAKKMGAIVSKIRKPRKVNVAGKRVVMIDGFCTFEMKLGDLPVETVTAYTFPLGTGIDLILGLPWLEKHNPHIDWKLCSLEFNRSGRRYMLWPAKPTPNIKIASPDEFAQFVDKSTSLYLIQRKDLLENHPPSSTDALLQTNMAPQPPSELSPSSVTKKSTACTAVAEGPRIPRKLERWIKRKCPELLREIGRPANLEPFDIDTGDAKPINIRPRPYSPVDLEKIKEFIDENLANGVISESKSPWSFPLVIAQKPNGGTRVCVDYRALNQVTVKDAHALPRIDESLLRFFGMRWFTSIDLRSGYWQILLSLLSREKTAFSTRYGHYEWNVLPFGLSNAPGAFQRRMNKVLRPYIDKFCIVYLDDILIFSKTEEEHERHVKTILGALDRAGMILNLDKCKFFRNQVRFLSHIIDQYGSRPDPRNIEKILKWATPRTITDVRGFVNLASHYRKYIAKFSDLALPLTDLMKGSPKKGTKIQWGEREEEAFNAIKKALTTNPVLRHPQIGKLFVIDPDSSQYILGMVLQQYFPDSKGKMRLHPIAFESKKLTETESRYSAQERELLAAKYALDHWRHIIEGSEILIRTDHQSLETYRTKKHITPRLVRFMQDIEHYNPTFTYRRGALQKVPDALSRMPGLREEGKPADTERFYSIRDILAASAEEAEPEKEPVQSPARRGHSVEYYGKLRKYLKASGLVDGTDDELKRDSSNYELRDGVLYSSELGTPVVIALEDLESVIESVHKDLGHYGKRTTLEGVRQRYIVGSDLWEEGGKVLDSCVPCQLYKRPAKVAENATIHPYGVKKAFELWEIDFVGKLVKTHAGNRYIITAIDYATSTAIAWALEERSAAVAIELLEDIVWTYGKPAEIITDNGEEFRSKEFQAALKRYNIQQNRTSPGHPQTNGKVERLNHEIVQRLQRISAEDGHDRRSWDEYLRQAIFAFHAHVNRRTGRTPFFLQYGVEPTLPSTTSVVNAPITRVEMEEAAHHRREHVQNLSRFRTEAAEKYNAALRRLVQARDDAADLQGPILIGDLVMRSPINRKSKLHPRWDGPFVVLDSTDKDVYQLGTANGYILENLVNVARLRKLNESERRGYIGDFWDASSRLQTRDKHAKAQGQLHELDVKLREATIANLEAQRQGERVTLDQIADISSQRRQLRRELARDPVPAAPDATSSDQHTKRSRRTRRPPFRFRET